MTFISSFYVPVNSSITIEGLKLFLTYGNLQLMD